MVAYTCTSNLSLLRKNRVVASALRFKAIMNILLVTLVFFIQLADRCRFCHTGIFRRDGPWRPLRVMVCQVRRMGMSCIGTISQAESADETLQIMQQTR